MGVDVLVFALVAAVILVVMLVARSGMQRPLREADPGLSVRVPSVELPPAALRPPAAPPRADDTRTLHASRDQAILLRRDFPPRADALSHWGGVPLASRGFTWPFFVTSDGHDRALHLVLQLDCSQLPAEGRLGLMPDRGLLYVFLDLDWGNHWKWSVRYEPGDPREFVPVRVPDSLPPAYAHRGSWGWPQHDEDWPRLLPFWSVDPVLLSGDGRPAEHEAGEEQDFWPGTIPLRARLEAIDGAILPTRYHQNSYDANGALGAALRRLPTPLAGGSDPDGSPHAPGRSQASRPLRQAR